MSEISLSLTTRIKPAKKFTVDGEEYQLLGIDHLSPDDENKVMALFARHSLLLAEQEGTENVTKGTAVAERVRKTRLEIICTLTDLPKSVAQALPLSGQARLLETLQEEISKDAEGEDEDAAEPGAEASGDLD